MTTTIEAKATEARQKTFTVEHEGARLLPIPLKNGGKITVYDGSASFWKNTAELGESKGEISVREVESPDVKDRRKSDFHVVVQLGEGATAVIRQKKGLQIKRRKGFTSVVLKQTEKARYG